MSHNIQVSSSDSQSRHSLSRTMEQESRIRRRVELQTRKEQLLQNVTKIEAEIDLFKQDIILVENDIASLPPLALGIEAFNAEFQLKLRHNRLLKDELTARNELRRLGSELATINGELQNLP